MPYRRCGRSGVLLPAISLGLWQNFGDSQSTAEIRSVIHRAIDLGITHFDLANNYGPPNGAAESNLGALLARDLRAHRDELLISTKAGYDMWPGPYGSGGSRKHLLSSLDQSLRHLNVDYVDIFYSHCVDPDTPVEETIGALSSAIRQGKALYAGISSYSPKRTAEAVAAMNAAGSSLTVHQPSYSMFNRWIEEELLDSVQEAGLGCVVFSPLAQGLLTDRYRHGVPNDSRAARQGSLRPEMRSKELLAKVGHLRAIADRRGQSLAQMALAWVLRDGRVTSALIGASSADQLTENAAAVGNLSFSAEELQEIDAYATESFVSQGRSHLL
jgi:L-glyceraldehyde 3-phosphate reductase